MKSIELIQVRSFSESNRQQVIDMLKSLPETGPGIPSNIQIFENQIQTTDLCICLFWDQTQLHFVKSALGENLAAAFKIFGWISYSVWNPLQEE
ncbi:MAG: hypothetical protein KKE62_14240 [Proteobacteria bacterium]|nr:hypothetical protein [Pseudomonadota bacterium]MBU1543989.1 hypothetical protein [Pseudomonadota bacterium]MBU2429584.1 hypothetical protein [Pseudomonadota bacterium]MBU2479964.1 hypothetical protein [Pseudomonadota bacterium]